MSDKCAINCEMQIAFYHFNFPEMTLCLLGVILLLGKYTGYRLFELYRFRDLAFKE